METSTQTETGGLTLRELQGLDKELRTISGSLRSTIAKSMAKQTDIDKEKQKLKSVPWTLPKFYFNRGLQRP